MIIAGNTDASERDGQLSEWRRRFIGMAHIVPRICIG